MIDIISQPWHWAISGAMIALVMFLLLWAGGSFGVSSTLRTACAIGGAAKQASFFDFDWKSQVWNLVFALGAIIGGYLAATFLANPNDLALSEATISDLQQLNIPFDGQLLPTSIFNWDYLLTARGILLMVLGGFLIGFGTRWAGGCTSGHAISGLSNLQAASLIAVIGFFIGGLVMTHLFFPFIFG